MDRTRSEYRLKPVPDITATTATPLSIRHVEISDRQAAATLLLDAYQGSVDDEGEDLDDALGAIDEYFGLIIWPHSYVLVDGDDMVAMSFVVVVNEVHYIDPVTTAAARKGNGLGSAVVGASMASMAAAGIDEVGAVITDGNSPSERLFAAFGFVRVGPWGTPPE